MQQLNEKKILADEGEEQQCVSKHVREEAKERKTAFVRGYNSIKYANDNIQLDIGSIKIVHDAPKSQVQKDVQAARQKARLTQQQIYNRTGVGARSDYKPKQITKSIEQKRKLSQQARRFAGERITKRQHITGQLNSSPYLDLSQRCHLKLSERLRCFSKHKFCMHNHRFNKIRLIAGQTRFLEVYCDHSRTHQVDNKDYRALCHDCGAENFTKFDELCGCEIYRCDKCRFFYYTWHRNVENYCHCDGIIEAAPIEGPKVISDPFKLKKSRKSYLQSLLKNERLDDMSEMKKTQLGTRSYSNVAGYTAPTINYNNNDLLRKLGNNGIQEIKETGGVMSFVSPIAAAVTDFKNRIMEKVNEHATKSLNAIVRKALRGSYTTVAEKTTQIWNASFMIVLRKAAKDYLNSLSITTLTSIYLSYKAGSWIAIIIELSKFIYYLCKALIDMIQDKYEKRDSTLTSDTIKIAAKEGSIQKDDDENEQSYLSRVKDYLNKKRIAARKRIHRWTEDPSDEEYETAPDNNFHKPVKQLIQLKEQSGTLFCYAGISLVGLLSILGWSQNHININKLHERCNLLRDQISGLVKTVIGNDKKVKELEKRVIDLRAELQVYINDKVAKLELEINKLDTQRSDHMNKEIMSLKDAIKALTGKQEFSLVISTIEEKIKKLSDGVEMPSTLPTDLSDEIKNLTKTISQLQRRLTTLEKIDETSDDEEEECDGFNCEDTHCENLHFKKLVSNVILTDYPSIAFVVDACKFGLACKNKSCKKIHEARIEDFCAFWNYTEDQVKIMMKRLNSGKIQEIEEQSGFDFSCITNVMTNLFNINMSHAWTSYIKPILATFNTVTTTARNADWIISKIKLVFKNIWGFTTPSAHLTWLVKNDEDWKKMVLLSYKIHNENYEDKDFPIIQQEAKILLSKAQSYAMEKGIIGEPIFANFLKNVEVRILKPQTFRTKRLEPLCVRIRGEPGCGKSQLWPLLVGHIIGKDTVGEVEAVTYTRNISDPYWSGFTSDTKIILYDDWGQNKDEVDMKELISLISGATMLPPLPSVDNSHLGLKGTEARPDIVVLLSNLPSKVGGMTTTLRSGDAVDRRSHLVFTQHKIKGAISNPDLARWTLDECYIDDTTLQSIKVRKEVLTLAQMQDVTKRAFDIHAEQMESTLKVSDEYLARKIIKEQAGVDLVDLAMLGMGAGAGLVAGAMKAYLTSLGVETGWKKMLKSSIGHMLLLVTVAVSTIFLTTSIINMMIGGTSEQSGTTKDRTIVKSIVPNCGTEDVRQSIKRNVVKVSTESGKYVNGIFLKGRSLMVPAHIFRGVKNGSIIRIKTFTAEEPYKIIFNRANLNKEEGSDLSVYTCTRYEIAQFPTIIHHLWDNDFDVTNRSASFTHYNVSNNSITSSIFNIELPVKIITCGDEVYDGTSNVQDVGVGRYHSEDGYCGNPIFLEENSVNTKMIGFHIGLNKTMLKTEGFFLFVSKKRAEKLIIEEGVELTLPEVIVGHEQGSIEVKGSNICIGTSNVSAYQPRKSEIIPSTIQGLLQEPTTEPSLLSNRDRRIFPKFEVNLMQQGVDKYSKLTAYDAYPQEYVTIASESMFREFTGRNPVFVRELEISQDLAINGHPLFPYMDKIDMSTSAGYPWVFRHLRKKDLFDFDGTKYTPTTVLQQALDEGWERWTNRQTTGTFFIDCLKDERLPLRKIYDKPKSRLFSVAPLVIVINTRRLFLHALSICMQFHNETYFSPGLDRTGLEWNKWFRRLAAKSYLGFDGDQENFDGTNYKQLLIESFMVPLNVLTHYLMGKPCWIKGEWNSMFKQPEFKEWRNRVEACMEETTSSIHLSENTLYQTCGGTTSGGPLTLAINCGVSELKMRLPFLAKVPSPMNSMHWYKKHVETSIMGDDNIGAATPQILPYYNAEVISEYHEKFGSKYTDAHKGVPVAFKKLEECSFLKNTTTDFHGLSAPKMELIPLIEMTNWVRSDKVHADEQTEINCNTMLRSLVFHGEEKFNEIRDKILERKSYYNLLTFDEVEQTYLKYGCYPGYDGNNTTSATTGESILSMIHLDKSEPRMNTIYATEQAGFYLLEDTIDIEGWSVERKKLLYQHITNIITDRRLYAAARFKHNTFRPRSEVFEDHKVTFDFTIYETESLKVYVEFLKQKLSKKITETSGQEIIESLVQPLKIITEVADLILDKPTFTDTVAVTRNYENYQVHTKGVANIEKFVMDPSEQILTDAEHFGTTRNSLVVKDLVGKRTLIDRFSFSTSDTVGTLLWSISVGPFWNGNWGTDKKDLATDMVTYYSRGMSHWRGGIKYEFDCVTSAFDEGVLDVTYHPLEYPIPQDYDRGVSQYFSSMQIRNSQSNYFKFTCPYMGYTPYRRVNNGNMQRFANTQDWDHRDYFNGTLGVRVSAPLRAPSTVPSTIEVLVYMSAADDFTIANPSFANSSISIYPGPKRTRTQEIMEIREQSGQGELVEQLTEDTTEETSEVLQTGDAGATGTFDDGAANQSSRQGTHLINQDSYKMTPGSNSKLLYDNSRRLRHLNDQFWTIEAQLTRWQLVDTVKWSLTDALNSKLKTLTVPSDVIVTSLASEPFSQYHAWSCKHIDIRCQIVASRYHQGRIIAGYIPNLGNDYTPKSIESFSTLNNFILDPSQGTTAEMRVPFIHPKGYLDLVNPLGQADNLGIFELRVMSQLTAAQDSSSVVEVKIFASLVGSEFKVPRSRPKQTMGDIRKKILKQREGQLVIKEQSGKFIDLAPKHIEVSDPKVKHFTEVVSDFRELMKRYVNLGVLASGEDQFPICLEGGLKQLMGTAAGWYLYNFQLYRGNIVWRIEAKSYDIQINSLESKTLISVAHVAQNIGMAAASLVMPGTSGLQQQTYQPLSVYSTNDKVVELEIPYVSRYASQPININPDNTIYFIDTDTLIIDVADKNKVFSYQLALSLRFADETQIGLWQGLPEIAINNLKGIDFW